MLLYVKYYTDLMKFSKIFDNFYGQSIYMTGQKVDIFSRPWKGQKES